MSAFLKAAICAPAFLALNVALLWAFPESPAVERYFAITSKVGEMIVYGRSLSHDIGPFLAANAINLLIYFLLFLLFWKWIERARLRQRGDRQE